VVCNAAGSSSRQALHLTYLGPTRQLTISLPAFVRTLLHLPDRFLDLLEIASYVYAADRLTNRGPKDAVEYQAWARQFQFVIRVRDFNFWSRRDVGDQLSELLEFMSGDRSYVFKFQPGHATPRTSLFDTDGGTIDPPPTAVVALFSGGLDSLTGAIELATQNPDEWICLVSHEAQAGTIRTQTQLHQALVGRFGNRIHRYGFRCTLHGIRSHDETQRTRMFLYSAIASSLARSFSRTEFYVYENGVTGLNLPLRQDLINARATRTTHPKTTRLLERFLSTVFEQDFKIRAPLIEHTKADVVRRLSSLGGKLLISSSVSCSRTFQNIGDATHCGACSQCIERRLAMYAAGCDDVDEAGIYSRNFIDRRIEDEETRTLLVDYIRQANRLASEGLDAFAAKFIGELADVTRYVGPGKEDELVLQTWTLLRRHGEQTMLALRRIRDLYDHPGKPTPPKSLLALIAEREYLKDPVERFVESVRARLSVGLPLAYQRKRPVDEAEVNDTVEALLSTDRADLEREHPAVLFALGTAVPDHSSGAYNAFIEVKYLRGSTKPSKASEGMAADLHKYPGSVHVVFVVYDPHRALKNDGKFKAAFERRGRSSVLVIR
jgi:hypothetical protein